MQVRERVEMKVCRNASTAAAAADINALSDYDSLKVMNEAAQSSKLSLIHQHI